MLMKLKHAAGQPVTKGIMMTLQNFDGTRQVDIIVLDEEGINNQAVITDKCGLIAVDHVIDFKLKSNLKSKTSWTERVENWIIKNGYLSKEEVKW